MYRVNDALLAQLAKAPLPPERPAASASEQQLEAMWLATCLTFGA